MTRTAAPPPATRRAPPARQAPARQAPKPGRMTLGNIRSSYAPDAPDRVLLHGVEGIGKTTWAAGWPNPVFIAAEDGLANLDVPAFPVPRTLEDVFEAVDTLALQEHEFQTLVVDTLDWLELLVYAAVLKRNNWSAAEADKYGRWVKVAVDDWRQLIARLEGLQARTGMHVVLLAHSDRQTVQNPAGDDYAQWQPRLMGKLANSLWKDWSRAVLFADRQLTVKTDGRVGKGQSSGVRMVHTEWAPAHEAKNRYALPPVIPLDPRVYLALRKGEEPADEFGASVPSQGEELRSQAYDLIDAMDTNEEARARVRAWADSHVDNPAELQRGIDQLKFRIQQQQEGQE